MNKKANLESFGLTIEQYNQIALQQNGRCAICGNPPNRWLVVDHCHQTGIIRGLLCELCNFGLGQFKDNPETLIKAIAYLTKVRPPVDLFATFIALGSGRGGHHRIPKSYSAFERRKTKENKQKKKYAEQMGK